MHEANRGEHSRGQRNVQKRARDDAPDPGLEAFAYDLRHAFC